MGTEVAAGIECITQILHCGQVALGKHLMHKVDFLHANAVLAGYGAAALQAFIQNLVAGEEDPPDLSRVPFVEQENGMNVAVAGVKDVDDPQFVAGGDFRDFAEDVRELRAGDDAVLRAVTGAEPADGSERLLAALPELEPLFGVGGEANLAGVALFAEGDDLVPLLVESRFQTVHFN